MIFNQKGGYMAALSYFWSMTIKSFHIATLHRGRYMLLLLAGVCLVTAIASRLPISEIAKILVVLVSLPLLIFCSTRWSKNDSVWTIQDGKIMIQFKNQQADSFPLNDIKYLRNVPRSGGNLMLFFFRKDKTPKRYWRNKLFEKADDLDALVHAIKQEGIEYYYM
ncbi:hypothetical protein [Sphingobacterium sp. SGR-19]|uniref:hypothetical protein n=1 Tax=Sphingobacterium sp. SGR-19 TaxID=2710886 RepID=UPI0013EC85A5|nr:hypothetical protein [Sphingobacterium sp. SGR-19]NGM66612.1 hypothetical protein [Sphingobacterium sp. SGR-19]